MSDIVAPTDLGTAGTANPEYVTARVRSRRAALFDEEDYRKLVRMGPGGIARYMEDTEYETEINALGARFSGVDLIEYALNRNLAKHFEDLLHWAEGSLYDLIARYLRKFDAWNVKTALRGIYSDAGPEAIRTDYVRAGELHHATLDQLSEADSIETAIDALEGTIYHEPLTEAFEEYEASDSLVPLENAVDRAFYQRQLRRIPAEREGPVALYVEFLQAEVDFLNVRNTMRLARSGADMDPAAYFIEGGRLFDAAEVRRLAADQDDLVAFIRESEYGEELDDALDRLEAADSMIAFEHSLDAALLAYADHLSSVYPVSITAVMGYVLAKEREVENIRAIARGREVGLGEEEIQNELVIT